jgi:aflatoxin B1 aldehyde reductase
MSGLKVIFGGAMISTGRAFSSKDDLDAVFALLKKHDVKVIDTAQLYGDSEELLGSVNAGSQFIIDTKWKGGFVEGSATKENVTSDAEASIKKLRTDKVSNAVFPYSTHQPLPR